MEINFLGEKFFKLIKRLPELTKFMIIFRLEIKSLVRIAVITFEKISFSVEIHFVLRS